MSKRSFFVGVDVGKDELWVAIDGYRPRRFVHCTSRDTLNASVGRGGR